MLFDKFGFFTAQTRNIISDIFLAEHKFVRFQFSYV